MKERSITKATENIIDIENKHLTFWVNSQLYSLPISYVIQILGMQEITSIPEFADCMKGVITIRDEVIPVMDLRLRFNLPEIPYDERTCIIISELGERKVGIIVDEVDSVTLISKSQITKSFKTIDIRNDFVIGVAKINDRIILQLNRNKIFDIDNKSQIDSIDYQNEISNALPNDLSNEVPNELPNEISNI